MFALLPVFPVPVSVPALAVYVSAGPALPLPVPARARALALVHTHGLPVSVRYFVFVFVALVCALARVHVLSPVCAHARASVRARVLSVSMGCLLSVGCLCQSLAVLPHCVQCSALCCADTVAAARIVVPFFLCISATIFAAAEVEGNLCPVGDLRSAVVTESPIVGL